MTQAVQNHATPHSHSFTSKYNARSSVRLVTWLVSKKLITNPVYIRHIYLQT